MTLNIVKEYFKNKADKYDDVEKQLYWMFSDELLWFNLKKTLDKLHKKFYFLDAGGGTGRWTEKILKEYPNSKGVLFDLSNSMLNVARKKMLEYLKKGRLKIIQGNFETANLQENLFDVSINLHNVLGFTKNPSKFIAKAVSFTKKRGYIISFVPNVYHGAYFNLTIGNIAEADKILRKNIGKFTKEMPDIIFFTPKQIMNIYKKNGLRKINICGFPCLIYPNFQETQISGQSMNLKKLLQSKYNYRRIISMEKLISKDIGISSRGNNIYIKGQK